MTTLRDYLRDNEYDDFDGKIRFTIKMWLQQKRLTIGKQTAFMLLQELLEDLE